MSYMRFGSISAGIVCVFVLFTPKIHAGIECAEGFRAEQKLAFNPERVKAGFANRAFLEAMPEFADSQIRSEFLGLRALVLPEQGLRTVRFFRTIISENDIEREFATQVLIDLEENGRPFSVLLSAHEMNSSQVPARLGDAFENKMTPRMPLYRIEDEGIKDEFGFDEIVIVEQDFNTHSELASMVVRLIYNGREVTDGNMTLMNDGSGRFRGVYDSSVSKKNLISIKTLPGGKLEATVDLWFGYGRYRLPINSNRATYRRDIDSKSPTKRRVNVGDFTPFFQ